MQLRHLKAAPERTWDAARSATVAAFAAARSLSSKGGFPTRGGSRTHTDDGAHAWQDEHNDSSSSSSILATGPDATDGCLSACQHFERRMSFRSARVSGGSMDSYLKSIPAVARSASASLAVSLQMAAASGTLVTPPWKTNRMSHLAACCLCELTLQPQVSACRPDLPAVLLHRAREHLFADTSVGWLGMVPTGLRCEPKIPSG